MFFFFFQAEDGIRDVAVTGVQTCALPISREPESADHDEAFARHGGATRIDVERGTAPGSEGEIPARDGVLPQELAEAALEGWDGRRCHMIVVAVATTTVNLSGELRA